VPRKPITVAQTPLFIRQAATVWDEAEREAFVAFIATHPEAGDVIPETGGAEGPLDAKWRRKARRRTRHLFLS
jgi:hypothetical protein